MADERPIGIFDSGLGGLTVLDAIATILPNESTLYVGDTARVPYGNKGCETIKRYSLEISHFLISHNVKCIVVACNTASALALKTLEEEFSIPLIGVIEPSIQEAKSLTKNGKIGIIGTRSTIESGVYQNSLQEFEVIGKPCPLFVPLVEENYLENRATEIIVESYLKGLKESSIDTLILGCTHYPILKKVINHFFEEKVSLCNSADATAYALLKLLEAKNLLADRKQAVRDFFSSDDPENFKRLSKIFSNVSISDVNRYTSQGCKDRVENSHKDFL